MEHFSDDVPQSKRPKVALPTKDEQKQLQQVDLLMKSNLLQLEVEQIISEVAGDRKLHKQKILDWIESVEVALKGAKIKQKLNQKSTRKAFNGVRIMELVNSNDESMEIVYEGPKSVTVVGSSAYHTSTNPMLNVDLLVTMPDGIFDTR